MPVGLSLLPLPGLLSYYSDERMFLRERSARGAERFLYRTPTGFPGGVRLVTRSAERSVPHPDY